MSRSNATPVLVIGAGIVGICCALALQKKGYKVTLVDRELPGSQTSFGNAGGIATTEVVPLSVPGIIWKAPQWLLNPSGPLCIRWRHLPHLVPWFWRFLRSGSRSNVEKAASVLADLLKNVYDDFEPLLQSAGIHHVLHKTGSLTVYHRRSAFAADSLEWTLKKERGIRFEVIGPQEIHDLEPDLAPIFAMAVRNLDWGHVDDPKQVCDGFFQYFLAQGGSYKQAHVTGFENPGLAIEGVTTDQGEKLIGAKVVIASGVWSKELLSMLGYKVSLESERGYHVTFNDPNATLQNMIISAEGKFVLTPMSVGLRVAGTAEFAGLSAPPDQRRTDVLIKSASRYLPKLNTRQLDRWSGHRPATPDSLPVIGELPDHANVYYAFGHGHLGLTLGPTTGRIIAELVDGEIDGQSLHALRVDRF